MIGNTYITFNTNPMKGSIKMNDWDTTSFSSKEEREKDEALKAYKAKRASEYHTIASELAEMDWFEYQQSMEESEDCSPMWIIEEQASKLLVERFGKYNPPA